MAHKLKLDDQVVYDLADERFLSNLNCDLKSQTIDFNLKPNQFDALNNNLVPNNNNFYNPKSLIN